MSSNEILGLSDVKYQAKPWRLLEGTLECRSLRIQSNDGKNKPLVPTDISISNVSVQIIESRTNVVSSVVEIVALKAITAIPYTTSSQLAGFDLLLSLTNSITTSPHYALVTAGCTYQANFSFVDDVTGKLWKKPAYFTMLDSDINPHPTGG